MKKLLTVLLTLVMAIGLVVLNNNHTKAEGNGTTYNITYTSDAWSINPTPIGGKFNKDDVLNFTLTSPEEYTIIDTYNVHHNLYDEEGLNSFTYTVEKDNITFTAVDNNPTFTLSDQDVVKCNGLKFSGADNKWYEYNDEDMDYKEIDDSRLDELGISYDSATNTATFSKDLTTLRTGDRQTIYIENSYLNISLDNDITIGNGSKNSCIEYITYANSESYVTINGKGHTLKLVNKANYATLYLKSNTIIKDIHLICEKENTFDEFDVTVTCLGNITLSGDCVVEIYSTGGEDAAGAIAFAFPRGGGEAGDITVPNGTKVGSATTKGENEDNVHKATSGSNQNQYVVGDTDDVRALYVRFTNTNPSPTPTPDPGKKDESCEKVIGPTWHWNNDKGICEDYGVVGTYTR